MSRAHVPLSLDSPGALGPTSSVDRVVLLLVALGTLARVAFVSTGPIVELLQRSTDDAYYYFLVAESIVQGRGITFDGVNPTNGFHPLWMVCLLPVSWLAGTDRDVAFRAVYGLVAVVGGAGFWAAYKAIATYASRTVALLGLGMLLTPVFLHSALNGLETGLLLLLLFSTVWAIARYSLLSPAAGTRQHIILGSLLALVVLCRLDAIFAACAIIATLWFAWLTQHNRPHNPLASFAWLTARVAAIPIVTVGAYLVWNMTVFGHASPISGALKSTFPTNTFTWARLADPHRLFGELQLCASAVGLLWLHLARRARGSTLPKAPDALPVLAALWSGSLVHWLYSTLYMNWAAHWWHFASYIPLTVITASLIVDDVLSRSTRRAALAASAAIVLAAVVGVSTYVDVVARGLHHRPWYDAALWARANLPENAVVGMTDSGLFSYFSRRRTVNLDGVINGYEYQRALRDGALSEYLSSTGVTHIADYEVRYRSNTYLIRLPARLYQRPGSALATTAEAEVYSGPPFSQLFGPDNVHFAIWPLGRIRVVDDAARLGRGE